MIPMTEKVCQLYEEEQVGKVRNGREAIPDSKMPDLGWDTMEEIESQIKEDRRTKHITKNTQEIGEIEDTVHILPDTIITIALLILTFLETIIPHIQKIPEIWRKPTQAVITMTRTAGHNIITNLHRITNRKHHHTENQTAKQKLNDGYDRSYHPYYTTAFHNNYD